MSRRTREQVVRSYLSELEAALAAIPGAVPGEVAREIVDGIAEELAGLDAAAALSRIEQLGDPAFIAAEARAESRPDAVAAPRSPAALAGDPRWYTVLASLLVAFGGIVLPLLGWVFGIAMVWASKTWRSWEKWAGTLAAPLVTAPTVLVVHWIATTGPGSGSATAGSPANPLLPAGYDTWWSGIVLLVLLNVLVGLWLLWSGLLRRGPRSGR